QLGRLLLLDSVVGIAVGYGCDPPALEGSPHPFEGFWSGVAEQVEPNEFVFLHLRRQLLAAIRVAGQVLWLVEERDANLGRIERLDFRHGIVRRERFDLGVQNFARIRTNLRTATDDRLGPGVARQVTWIRCDFRLTVGFDNLRKLDRWELSRPVVL